MNSFQKFLKKEKLIECSYCEITNSIFKHSNDCNIKNICIKYYEKEKICYNCNTHHIIWINEFKSLKK